MKIYTRPWVCHSGERRDISLRVGWGTGLVDALPGCDAVGVGRGPGPVAQGLEAISADSGRPEPPGGPDGDFLVAAFLLK